MTARVTTIVPTFRRPRMLARAVRSALKQSYRELRVDIYDNASGDETAEVAAALMAEDPRVHYHPRRVNIGLVENFARAQTEVETEFFSFLADDDILLPGFYQRAVASLDAAPAAIFTASPVLFVDPAGRILLIEGSQWPSGIHQPPGGMLELIDRGHFVWTGTMFRRTATESAGTLDPTAGVCADLDFQLRVAGGHAFITMPEPGAVFSWHPSSATSLPQLHQFWPTWPSIAARVANDRSLPAGARGETARRLLDRLPRKVFLAGMLAVSRGQVPEALEAAAVLSGKLGRPVEAWLLRLVTAACGRLPPLRSGLRALGERIRWRHRVAKDVQAEFERTSSGLLALPPLPLAVDRKDSAA